MPEDVTAGIASITKNIENDSSLTPDQKNQYIALVNSLNPLIKDNWIYRIVVLSLGLAVILTVLGGIIVALKGGSNTPLPEGLVAIGSASVGALAGLLAPSPKN